MTRRGFLAALPLVGPAAVAAVRAVEGDFPRPLTVDSDEWCPVDGLYERAAKEQGPLYLHSVGETWEWTADPPGPVRWRLNAPEVRWLDGDPLGE